MSSQNAAQAILAYEPTADAPMKPNWKLEDVQVSAPKEDEVLVQMVRIVLFYSISPVSSRSPGLDCSPVLGRNGHMPYRHRAHDSSCRSIGYQLSENRWT